MAGSGRRIALECNRKAGDGDIERVWQAWSDREGSELRLRSRRGRERWGQNTTSWMASFRLPATD